MRLLFFPHFLWFSFLDFSESDFCQSRYFIICSFSQRWILFCKDSSAEEAIFSSYLHRRSCRVFRSRKNFWSMRSDDDVVHAWFFGVFYSMVSMSGSNINNHVIILHFFCCIDLSTSRIIVSILYPILDTVWILIESIASTFLIFTSQYLSLYHTSRCLSKRHLWISPHTFTGNYWGTQIVSHYHISHISYKLRRLWYDTRCMFYFSSSSCIYCT